MALNTQVQVKIDAIDRTAAAFSSASRNADKLANRIDKMRPAFQKMFAVGTATMAGLGTGIYKATQQASDAQEIFNKFDVVFGDVSKGAEQVAQDLRNNFGLAESSAKDLLGSTGDMLTGFGLSGEAALDLAGRTNKLAVDLASFTNIQGGAERASRSLTKALLGERESVKELGIAILEEDVKAKIKSMRATGELTNETDRQAKAIATLELAYEQSKNAVGDYARTQDQLANMQRTLGQRFKELTEALGKAFIPLLTDIVNKVTPVVEKFRDWADANPELIRKIAGVTMAISAFLAVVGGIGLVLPSFLRGFSAISSAVTSLIGGFKAISSIALGAKSGLAVLGVTLSGPVIGGILAVVAAGALLYSQWDKIKNHPLIKKTWQTIRIAINATIDSLKEIWYQFSSLWREVGTSLQPVLEYLAKLLAGAVVGGLVVVTAGIRGLVFIVEKAVTSFRDFLHWLGLIDKQVQGNASKFQNMANATDRVFGSTQNYGTALERLQANLNNTTQNTDTATDSLDGLARGATGASNSVSEAGERMEDAMSEVTEKIESTRSEILSLYDEVNNRANNYKSDQKNAEQDYHNKVVDIVANAERKKKELRDQLENARESNDSQEVKRLEEKISEQKNILRTYRNFELNLDEQIAERKKVLGMNELERAQHEFERKKLLIQKEYLEEQVSSLKKIVLKKQEYKELIALKNNEVAMRKMAEESATLVWNKELEKRQNSLVDFANNSVSEYERIERAATRAARASRRSSSIGGNSISVDDAVISPQGKVITTNPQDYLIATKNPASLGQGGGGTNIINIYDNEILGGDDVAEKIGNRIVDEIARNKRMPRV